MTKNEKINKLIKNHKGEWIAIIHHSKDDPEDPKVVASAESCEELAKKIENMNNIFVLKINKEEPDSYLLEAI